jgi:hypothetical protein
MDIQFPARIVPFDNLDVGDTFVAAFQNQNHLCVKSREERDGGELISFVSLVPGNPDFGDCPCVYNVRMLGWPHILQLENVSLQLLTEREDLEFDQNYLPDPGCVFVFGTTPLICLQNYGDHILFDIRTGTLTRRAPERDYAKIRRWALVQTLDGVARELETYEAPRRA